jgi:hypothetical protein
VIGGLWRGPPRGRNAVLTCLSLRDKIRIRDRFGRSREVGCVGSAIVDHRRRHRRHASPHTERRSGHGAVGEPTAGAAPEGEPHDDECSHGVLGEDDPSERPPTRQRSERGLSCGSSHGLTPADAGNGSQGVASARHEAHPHPQHVSDASASRARGREIQICGCHECVGTKAAVERFGAGASGGTDGAGAGGGQGGDVDHAGGRDDGPRSHESGPFEMMSRDGPPLGGVRPSFGAFARPALVAVQPRESRRSATNPLVNVIFLLSRGLRQ